MNIFDMLLVPGGNKTGSGSKARPKSDAYPKTDFFKILALNLGQKDLSLSTLNVKSGGFSRNDVFADTENGADLADIDSLSALFEGTKSFFLDGGSRKDSKSSSISSLANLFTSQKSFIKDDSLEFASNKNVKNGNRAFENKEIKIDSDQKESKNDLKIGSLAVAASLEPDLASRSKNGQKVNEKVLNGSVRIEKNSLKEDPLNRKSVLLEPKSVDIYKSAETATNDEERSIWAVAGGLEESFNNGGFVFSAKPEKPADFTDSSRTDSGKEHPRAVFGSFDEVSGFKKNMSAEKAEKIEKESFKTDEHFDERILRKEIPKRDLQIVKNVSVQNPISETEPKKAPSPQEDILNLRTEQKNSVAVGVESPELRGHETDRNGKDLLEGFNRKSEIHKETASKKDIVKTVQSQRVEDKFFAESTTQTGESAKESVSAQSIQQQAPVAKEQPLPLFALSSSVSEASSGSFSSTDNGGGEGGGRFEEGGDVQPKTTQNGKNSFTFRLNDTVINATIKNQHLNLVLSAHSTVFTPSLEREIQTILRDSGFKTFSLTLRDREKRVYLNYDETRTTSKRAHQSRINVMA